MLMGEDGSAEYQGGSLEQEFSQINDELRTYLEGKDKGSAASIALQDIINQVIALRDLKSARSDYEKNVNEERPLLAAYVSAAIVSQHQVEREITHRKLVEPGYVEAYKTIKEIKEKYQRASIGSQVPVESKVLENLSAVQLSVYPEL